MEEKLLRMIGKICDEEIGADELDLNLYESGLMDSLAMVELLIAIEDEFGVTLSPTEYNKEAFSTVRSIEEILKGKGITA